MVSKIRFIVKDEDWSSIPLSHWVGYKGIPANVMQLNGYVLCTLQNVVPSKVNLFRSIPNVQVFETLESIKQFQSDNPKIWDDTGDEQ